jgi:hypothetical protein
MGVDTASDVLRRNPITGIFGCCARVASGQAAVVLARPAMKLRRLMGVALRPGNTLAQHRTTTVQCGTAKGLMSAMGQKQTSLGVRTMSALPPKAEVAQQIGFVL